MKRLSYIIICLLIISCSGNISSELYKSQKNYFRTSEIYVPKSILSTFKKSRIIAIDSLKKNFKDFGNDTLLFVEEYSIQSGMIYSTLKSLSSNQVYNYELYVRDDDIFFKPNLLPDQKLNIAFLSNYDKDSTIILDGNCSLVSILVIKENKIIDIKHMYFPKGIWW